MVRGKTQVRRIENDMSRQVTFSKRRSGLLKKAFELSVLCDAEVGIIVFSQRGKLSEFSSSSMQRTIERYKSRAKATNINHSSAEENIEHWKQEAANAAKMMEVLEQSRRKLMGEGLESCSFEELHDLESQLQRSLTNIREQKNNLMSEQLAQLKDQEKMLLLENAALHQLRKGTSLVRFGVSERAGDVNNYSQHKEVETDLHIGWPERGRTQRLLQGQVATL
uniref:SUPRESSOR OF OVEREXPRESSION OF CONSTANS1 n=1 Tax=Freesia hybrid cultivar TaxID=867926 RepID=A0A5S9MP98_9ASPA|nr:SUPRESSOR OF OVEREXPRESSION OF CONSTANS1 [Freesia hybrid cultivar]